jgi:hypothetical protein
VRACVADGNTGDGINIANGGSVLDCTALHNGQTGIFINNGEVTRCLADSNTNWINIFNHGVVKECRASGNSGDGITVRINCLVLENTCEINGSGFVGSAGIHARGEANRIEANHLTGNVRFGLLVTSTNNIVIRNSAIQNGSGNYSIAAGNKDAEQIAPGSGFISTDPWANFSY